MNIVIGGAGEDIGHLLYFQISDTFQFGIDIGDDCKGGIDALVELFEESCFCMMGIFDDFGAEIFRINLGEDGLLTGALHIRREEHPAVAVFDHGKGAVAVHIQVWIIRKEKLQGDLAVSHGENLTVIIEGNGNACLACVVHGCDHGLG